MMLTEFLREGRRSPKSASPNSKGVDLRRRQAVLARPGWIDGVASVMAGKNKHGLSRCLSTPEALCSRSGQVEDVGAS